SAKPDRAVVDDRARVAAGPVARALSGSSAAVISDATLDLELQRWEAKRAGGMAGGKVGGRGGSSPRLAATGNAGAAVASAWLGARHRRCLAPLARNARNRPALQASASGDLYSDGCRVADGHVFQSLRGTHPPAASVYCAGQATRVEVCLARRF